MIFTNLYEGASDNNNETAYSVHFMYNHQLVRYTVCLGIFVIALDNCCDNRRN